MKNICDRLLDERERLKLNKGQMAAAGGIANSTYTNYEEGKRSPDGDFLAGIAAAGADVQYILTGVRSANALTPDEELLLTGYRTMDARGKAGALGMISGMTQPKNAISQQFNASVGQVIQGDIKNNKFKMPKS